VNTAPAQTGLIVAAHGQRGLLESADGRTLRYLVRSRRIRAVCGDQVRWSPSGDPGEVVVAEVLPRANALCRPAPRDGSPEVVAANLTHLLIVSAPEPAPDFFLLDRFLCAAELLPCQPVLLWNKADIQAEPPPAFGLYRALGYDVVAVCARHGIPGQLLSLLGGGRAAIVGTSGVGKSSLVNALVPGAAATVGDLSAARAAGRHTTTACLLYRLPGNASLIDTPGVRDFVPLIPRDRPVASGFVEMRRAAQGCRFTDCRHLAEPGCAVRAGVESGAIGTRRYESYRRLLEMLAERGPAPGDFRSPRG
jgi:ribosome biogenesis GTPase